MLFDIYIEPNVNGSAGLETVPRFLRFAIPRRCASKPLRSSVRIVQDISVILAQSKSESRAIATLQRIRTHLRWTLDLAKIA